MRETFKVEDLRQQVNAMHLTSPDDMRRERIACAMILESILMDTGNYNGFGYVNADGDAVPTADINARNYDDSRRHYYGR